MQEQNEGFQNFLRLCKIIAVMEHDFVLSDREVKTGRRGETNVLLAFVQFNLNNVSKI